MLRAIVHNKAGRVDVDGKSTRWRDLYKTHEDPLTSMVFSRLSYLSADACRYFFSSIFGEDSGLEGIDEIDFWPGWELDGHRVEPDVVIRSGDTLLIVEAKRPSRERTQDVEQWSREVRAAADSAADHQRLHFLAVDGFGALVSHALREMLDGESRLEGASVFGMTWLEISQVLHRIPASERTSSDDRVIADIAAGLSLYGIVRHTYFGFSTIVPVLPATDCGFPYWEVQGINRESGWPGWCGVWPSIDIRLC